MEEKEFQSFSSFDPCDEKDGSSLSSYPNTPGTPIMSNTPDTSGFSVNDEGEQSQFSLSMDSGIESPQGFMLTGTPVVNLSNGQSRTSQQSSRQKISQSIKAAEHTNKEKLRRERIKDSCDQLRVLLPYVRGRKTDMASILEMCVEYLRIVNAFMPQTLQQQIVDILSKECPEVFTDTPSKEGKVVMPNKVNKVETTSNSPQRTSFSSDKASNFNMPVPVSLPSSDVHSDYGEERSSKRIHLQDVGRVSTHLHDLSRTATHLQDIGHTSTHLHDAGRTSTQFEERIELNGSSPSDSNPTYTFHGSSVGSLHLDDQSYGRIYGDGYSAAQQIFNNYANNKTLEPDYLRPTYFDPLQFYPGMLNNTIVPQPRIFPSVSDYVNPNVVLQTMQPSGMIVKTMPSSSKVDSFNSVSNMMDSHKDEKPS